MTIQEYYDNYYKTKRFPNQLLNSVKNDKTIKDFYDNCIYKNQCSKSDVLAWHEMFLDYLKLPDAIYWIRYYESGSKINGRWTNRRACYTEFKDGFSYVFVSNFDVHEVFNMIYQGVTPNAQEFLNLMKTFKYQLHYDSGKSCEESDICAYQNIGSPHGGVLTVNHWYLAHINAIKGGYRRINGSVQELSDQEINRIFPRGKISDWKSDKFDGIMKRKLNYSLSQEEKDLVKAHFLRFVDPLNYFVVPGVNYEINDIYGDKKKSIGEFGDLISYVSHQFELVYGKQPIMDFRDKALLASLNSINTANIANKVINISYSNVIQKTKNSSSSISHTVKPILASPTKTKTTIGKTTSGGNVAKVGEIAKKDLRNVLVNSTKVTNKDISDLQDKSISKALFEINFPVLDVAPADKKRYYAKPVTIKGKNYFLCSQWYDRHRQALEDWIDTHK